METIETIELVIFMLQVAMIAICIIPACICILVGLSYKYLNYLYNSIGEEQRIDNPKDRRISNYLSYRMFFYGVIRNSGAKWFRVLALVSMTFIWGYPLMVICFISSWSIRGMYRWICTMWKKI